MSPRKAAGPTPLGSYIVRRRNEKGWNTADLAREAELKYETVRNVEKGYSQKPAEWILRALIRVLECDEGVVFALAGYGELPERTPDQVVVALDSLGDDAPSWRDEIEYVKTMTPEQQRLALRILRAQRTSASHHP